MPRSGLVVDFWNPAVPARPIDGVTMRDDEGR